MTDVDTMIFPHPAQVLRQRFTPAADLLALAIQGRALDATVFDDFPPFFWPAEISSNRLDAYFTRMAPTTLRNFAQESQTGVAFQNSHQVYELSIGRSLTGLYEEQGDLARVIAEFYTVPGLQLNRVNTDDFILGVRSGLVSDVSVGFYGGEFRCSLCGRDMLRDWDCPHVPGVSYDVRDPKGEVVGEEVATAWVENAHLAEVSAVYDGATPGAAILKAQQEAEAGRLRPETARLLEARYRIALPQAPGNAPGRRLATPGVTLKTKLIGRDLAIGEVRSPDPMTEEVKLMTEDIVETIDRATGSIDAAVVILERAGIARADLEDMVRMLVDELARLRPLADDGRQYRTDLIAEALCEGVRAHGEGFSQETYGGLLAQAPLATIKRMRDDWRVIADKQFPGGRQTKDAHEPPAVSATPVAVPTWTHQG